VAAAEIPSPDAELLEAFVNTRRPITARTDPATDAIDTPAGAIAWLLSRQLVRQPQAQLSFADVDRLVALRETLRDLMAAHNGVDITESSVTTWNELAQRASVHPMLRSDGGIEMRSLADGPDGALGALLAAATRAMMDGTFDRLKACRSPDCRWAFYDRSPNGRRIWCETSAASCGSRHKMRAYRARAGERGAAFDLRT
jgi:predicted RNA-binding Zn ribbon-like protein